MVLGAAVVALASMLVVAATGDDKPPYNDPTIAVIAWVSMLIAGATFLVLGVIWWVMLIVKTRQHPRAQ